MPLDLQDLREDYTHSELLESNASEDPLRQFEAWFAAARSARIAEPNAMILATAAPDGRPAARVVLLKEVNPRGGFVFYTNYRSRKGEELSANPYAALCFNWLEQQRQVRIEGRVERVPAEDSTAYFQSRPRGSQLGAWASPQSSVVPNREVLEAQVSELEAEFSGQDNLPRPDHWGGYAVIPDRIEFWQGRSNRLHDRLEYRRGEHGDWERVRLAP